MFMVIRDGTGYLQCVLNGKLCHTYDALTMTVESTVTIHGSIKSVPADKKAPGDLELHADYWECIHKAPGGDEAFTNKINEVGGVCCINYLRGLIVELKLVGRTLAQTCCTTRDILSFGVKRCLLS
jgi:aspartyl/asparaginyl-tRNA synthetase